MDISNQAFPHLRTRMFQEWLFEVQEIGSSRYVFSALRAWIWRIDIVALMVWGKERLLDIKVILMTPRSMASNASDELRGPKNHGILEMWSFSLGPSDNIQWKNTSFVKSMKNIRYFQKIVHSDYFLSFLSVRQDDLEPNHLLIQTC